LLSLWHLLVHATGCDYGAPYGRWVPYDFWSGVSGSFLVGVTVWALGFYWHNQCGVHGCYWYARRTTAAGERACWKHHPHPKRTVEDLHAAHHAVMRARTPDNHHGQGGTR